MNKTQIYQLNQTICASFFTNHLNELNLLSQSLLKNIDLKKGKFFTILKKNLTKKEVHNFRNGGMGNESVIQNTIQYITDLKEKRICIFDDIIEKYDPNTSFDLFHKFGIHVKEEVYYTLCENEINCTNIAHCLHASDSMWHSLSVISNTDWKRNKETKIEEITHITKNATLILLLAYDAEGYIIWEKSSIT